MYHMLNSHFLQIIPAHPTFKHSGFCEALKLLKDKIAEKKAKIQHFPETGQWLGHQRSGACVVRLYLMFI